MSTATSQAHPISFIMDKQPVNVFSVHYLLPRRYSGPKDIRIYNHDHLLCVSVLRAGEW